MCPSAASSEASKNPCLSDGKEVVVIQYLPSSMAVQLLNKFPDNSAFDFDYSQSALWSPPVVRPFHPLPLSRKTPKRASMALFSKLTISKLKKKIAMNLTRKIEEFKYKSDEFPASPSSSARKGWGKALKVVKSKQFKKKKKDNPSLHMRLSDYLQSTDS